MIVLVVLDPGIAGQLGFVLSVLATAGLLLVAEPVARRLGEVLPRPLALVLAVPIAAQAACQPVVLLVDPSVPVYGVLANLLAEPAAPAATGLGLIGCLLAPGGRRRPTPRSVSRRCRRGGSPRSPAPSPPGPPRDSPGGRGRAECSRSQCSPFWVWCS
ncbi:ComEC/Rec2 family competence protein [Rathayibacter oskolensis]|uniref:ComEC/Rec2 family competence protein n=1 Tax=Rathayibacter oskolensis TaxID=1891671 RepID=UPI00265EFC3A|nr:ComEC/Rec2 family competence protein [Rathayibacter oskolensis]WKK71605.1 ComEC/Rec2 family competence protein [Rathayibacter oskolensis]